METVIQASSRTVRAMAPDFHLHLPDFPPQRLLAEAVMAANLRHLEMEPLDLETSEWPLLVSVTLAYLRHNLSAYDERLRARCEHDPEYRDELAEQVAVAAFRKYRWLREDPRPFPESDISWSPIFTILARGLTEDYGVRDQLHSAMRDLRREGKSAQVAALKVTLGKIEQRIKRSYETLTSPKYGDQSSRTFDLSHLPEEMGRYYFFDDRVVTPNRYHFAGFRCDECEAPVVRLKQPVDFGQGWRMQVHSCHCRTLATACPPAGRRLKPLTSQRWNFVAVAEEVAT